ncbi:type II toxin-antitoxin system antitoxin SocA domain-containing protein [Williamsoniiplasma luminosum]|nr:type II toxin-antitoxin system antitoxin SocA domain-containing protein [Williamsoniiplasma luminosum]
MAKENNFTVYKTHLLKFISILELEYVKEAGNFFTGQKLIKMENGPVPSKFDDFLKEIIKCNKNCNTFPFNVKMVGITEPKAIVEWNNNFETFDIFTSKFQLEIIKASVEIIFEEKTVLNLSNYTHKYKSWITAKMNKEINLFDEIIDEERKKEMEMIYG